MRIAVNARLLLSTKMEGIGWYSYEVLRRLVLGNPEHHFVFFFDRPFDERFVFGPNVTPLVLNPPARHPFLTLAWFEWSVERALRSSRADLFYSPDGLLSLRTKVPSVPVIHDLNFEHDPRYMKPIDLWYWKTFLPRFARKAARVITISDHSRRDIIDRYGVAPENIETIYNGVNDAYAPVPLEKQHATRVAYARGKPYFLFVGAQNPRKNIDGLFRAYDEYCQRNGTDVALVIVGARMHWSDEIERAYSSMRFKEHVIFTGHLPQHELEKVMGSAEALVFVSHFEGFGVPAIEAMRANVPVITSTTSCMPEIVGDAAVLCDPTSIPEIVTAMERVTSDAQLRSTLIARGIERSQRFSWDRTAEQTWNCLTTVHNTRP